MFTHSVRFIVYLYDVRGDLQHTLEFYDVRFPFCFGWLQSLKDEYQRTLHEKLYMLHYPEIRVCYEIDGFRFITTRSDARM